MKVCNSKNFSCILVAASLLFTSLFFSCSNGSSGSGGSDPTTTPATNTPGGGSGGGGSGGGGTPPAPTTLNSITNPITLSVPIPANTLNVEIRRRKVTASHGVIYGEGTLVVGRLSFQSTDTGFDTARTKSFTDLFGVQSGSCYEYTVFTQVQGQSGTTGTPVYHTATYNGLTPPSFGSGNAYPEIKYTNTPSKKLSLNNANNVSITYHNSEQPENNYWMIKLTYNWYINSFFDPTNVEYTIPTYNVNTEPTGDNLLTDVSLELKFSNDNNCDFVRVIHLNTNSIDGSKIDKKIIVTGPRASNGSDVYMNIKYPLNNPHIRDIYVQRRIHSNATWEKPTGYLDNRNTDWTVGYLHETDISSCINEYGFIKFADRYNFDTNAQEYDYRAIIRTGENFEEIELPLGKTDEVTPAVRTPDIPTLYLQKFWNEQNNQSLRLHEYQNLGSTEFYLLLSYVKEGDESKGFYPVFKYTTGENVDTVRVPDNLGNSYTLTPVSFNLALKTHGNEIRQVIRQNLATVTLPNRIRDPLVYPSQD